MARAAKKRRRCAVILCLFVCLFFAHAKLSGFQYRVELTSGADLTATSAAQKIHSNKIISTADIFWVLSLFLYWFLPLRVKVGGSALATVVPSSLSALEAYRFLRPPPALSVIHF